MLRTHRDLLDRVEPVSSCRKDPDLFDCGATLINCVTVSFWNTALLSKFHSGGAPNALFFTPCLDIYGNIAAIIICEQLLENESKISLHNFGNNNGIPIFDIPTEDAIGSGNKLGAFATNALPLPGLLIKPSFFTLKSIIRLSDAALTISKSLPLDLWEEIKKTQSWQKNKV